MDTDDFSQEAYEALILAAGRFNPDLTLQFGLLSERCSDEHDFLDHCLVLIAELKRYDPGLLSDIFYDNIPELTAFRKALEMIARNIREFKKIPLARRKVPDDDSDAGDINRESR